MTLVNSRFLFNYTARPGSQEASIDLACSDDGSFARLPRLANARYLILTSRALAVLLFVHVSGLGLLRLTQNTQLTCPVGSVVYVSRFWYGCSPCPPNTVSFQCFPSLIERCGSCLIWGISWCAVPDHARVVGRWPNAVRGPVSVSVVFVCLTPRFVCIVCCSARPARTVRSASRAGTRSRRKTVRAEL